VACFEEVLDTLGAEGKVRWQLAARFGLALASGLLCDMARAAACHKEILVITELHGGVYLRSYSLWTSGSWRGGTTIPGGRPSWSTRACC
jgi:hypothetical protein